jgi:flagellar biosynthesis protein FlhF
VVILNQPVAISASSVSQAMRKVKEQLGSDAVVLSIDDRIDCVTVMATANHYPPSFEKVLKTQSDDVAFLQKSENHYVQKSSEDSKDAIQTVCEMCDHHQVSYEFCEAWVKSLDDENPTTDSAVKAAFKSVYSHAPINFRNYPSLIFIGPQGSGKTVMIAKLAAALSQQNFPVMVGTLDTIKSGGIEQLQHYTDVMELDLYVGEQVHQAVLDSAAVCLVDTPGINIKRKEDHILLNDILGRIEGSIVLVIPADANPHEISQLVHLYQTFRPHYVMISKFDTTDYRGTILNVNQDLKIPVSYYSDSPSVGEGVKLASADAIFEDMQHFKKKKGL